MVSERNIHTFILLQEIRKQSTRAFLRIIHSGTISKMRKMSGSYQTVAANDESTLEKKPVISRPTDNKDVFMFTKGILLGYGTSTTVT